MPQRFVNVYSPQTPIGAGLQNIALALFGGPTPRELETERIKNESLAAQGRAYDANARKLAAEAAGAEAAQARARALPLEIATSIFGDRPRGEQFLAARDLGDTALAVGPTGPQLPVRPEWMTGDRAALANRLMLAPGMVAAAGRGNAPGAIDDVLKAIFQQEVAGDILSGRRQPTPVAQAGYAAGIHGNEPFKALPEGAGALNVTTGDDALNAIGRALVALNEAKAGTERAQAGKYGAEAGAARQHGRLYGAQAGAAERDLAQPAATVTVGWDAAGNPVTAPIPGRRLTAQIPTRPQIEQQKADAATKKAEKSDRRISMTKTEAEQLTEAVNSLTGASKELPLEGNVRAQIMSRAAQLVTDPQSEFFKDPSGAAEAAVQEVSPRGFETAGEWNPFRSNERVPVGGAKPRPITAAPAQAAGQDIPQITNAADYAKIPMGARYRDPQGNVRTKGGA